MDYLPEIQIKLEFMYFYLLNLANIVWSTLKSWGQDFQTKLILLHIATTVMSFIVKLIEPLKPGFSA